ncbi:unnamed protein product, partial [marine sediment metagenome]
MHDLREANKLDWGIKPQKGATSINGEWFNVKTYAKALFTAGISLQTYGQSLTFQVWESTSAAGDGTPAQLGETITMAHGVKVTMAQIKCTSVVLNDTVTITPYTFNGQGVLTAGTALVFTAKTAESLPNRQFDYDDDDNATAVSLMACINDATYGVPGLLGVEGSVNDIVVLTLTEPGDGAFTYVESD